MEIKGKRVQALLGTKIIIFSLTFFNVSNSNQIHRDLFAIKNLSYEIASIALYAERASIIIIMLISLHAI